MLLVFKGKKKTQKSSVYNITSNTERINNNIQDIFIHRGIIITNIIIRRSNDQRWREHKVLEVCVLVDVVKWHHVVDAK